MKKIAYLYLIRSLLLILAFASGYLCFAQVKAINLKCEGLTEPLGIDKKSPAFSWQLEATGRNIFQTGYEIEVTEKGNKVWNSGKIDNDQSLHVLYNGDPLATGKKYEWRVRVWDQSKKAGSWSNKASFRMAMLDTADWKAKWIESPIVEDPVNRSPQHFRKEFLINKKISSAIAYITAHGMYEAELNGMRIGDQYLSPGWTSYNKRLPYQCYDLSNSLKQGVNCIGATVANGWYRGFLAWSDQKNIYGDKLGLFLQLVINYTDGSSESIITNKNWNTSLGKIVYAEIYHGETIDARLEKKGWSTPGYNTDGWSAAIEKPYPLFNLYASSNEPIRKHELIKPVKIITTPKGEKVIDFGQNLVGWVIVKASGRNGTNFSVQHAEVLDKHGNFYTDNLRIARCTDKYYLKGEGVETFEPHFTFHGFRYIRLIDYPGEINPENFNAVALYSDMKPTGEFYSSNKLINQLQHNIEWGQKGNFLDVPTDCPQRDERLGWTGDAQVFSNTAAFNFDVHLFFKKWLQDLAADQSADGRVPFVIPQVLKESDGGSAGWADAATIIPWNIYKVYGDKRLLEQQFESMKSWVAFMTSKSTNYLWNKGFHFGDWLFYRPFDDNDGRSAVTNKYLIAQCFYRYSSLLVAKAARALGKTKEAEEYEALSEKVKLAFQQEYLTPGGRLVSGTQTAYTLALHFDMLPEEQRNSAAQKLVDDIISYNYHLTTGFLGTPYLCHVLTRFGHEDIAFRLLMQESYPSWLYPVKMGATTIWERWNGIRPDSSFETPGMNSFNHYAYGAIGDWMYRSVAGIDQENDGVAYKKIKICPHVGGGLNEAGASLQTGYGIVSSKWKLENKDLSLKIIIPPNTSAMVHIPSEEMDKVNESGKPVSTIKDVKFIRKEKGYLIFSVPSGAYDFLIRN